MIVQIRGPQGSGKSTAVRNIMAEYEHQSPIYVGGRRQPIAYELFNDEGAPLVVIGHYESIKGGCDTIPKIDEIYNLVRSSHLHGNHVLFEGLKISSDIKRTAQLNEDGYPVRVLYLHTDPTHCLNRINAVRKERMGDKYIPIKESAIYSKLKGIRGTAGKLTELKVPTINVFENTIHNTIRELISL